MKPVTPRFAKLTLCMVGAALLLAGTGCETPTSGVNDWTLENLDGPNVALSSDSLSIDVIYATVQASGSATIEIPGMHDSSIEVSPDPITGGLHFLATISTNDLSAITGDSNSLGAQELPGGRLLPGVAGGSLPAVSVQIPELESATFYANKTLFGLFLPVSFDANQALGPFAYFDTTGEEQLGTIDIVGKDANGLNSGFLLMLNLSDIASGVQEARNQASQEK